MCDKCNDKSSWSDFFAVVALLCIFIAGVSSIAYTMTQLLGH